MKVAIIGATGFVGSKILTEAISRGHSVTAISRRPENAPKLDHVRALKVEVTDVPNLTEALKGHDAVIHSASPAREMEMDPKIKTQLEITDAILAATKAAGVKRMLAVGGAGTLKIDGVRHIDRPDFPQQYIGGATAGAKNKERIFEEKDLDWTILSPSTMIVPGERTGKFRLGLDDLLRKPDGTSSISVEDYAVAMIDELEHPKHSHKRFTVGY
jgi:putative NADH-flavin reductase